jgi:hypothetical protein
MPGPTLFFRMSIAQLAMVAFVEDLLADSEKRFVKDAAPPPPDFPRFFRF